MHMHACIPSSWSFYNWWLLMDHTWRDVRAATFWSFLILCCYVSRFLSFWKALKGESWFLSDQKSSHVESLAVELGANQGSTSWNKQRFTMQFHIIWGVLEQRPGGTYYLGSWWTCCLKHAPCGRISNPGNGELTEWKNQIMTCTQNGFDFMRQMLVAVQVIVNIKDVHQLGTRDQPWSC